MTEIEKQTIEQIAGAAIATAESTALLIQMLVRTKTFTPAQAALALSDLAGHINDLAKKNAHLPGQAQIFKVVANRYQQYQDALEKETGAKASLNALK